MERLGIVVIQLEEAKRLLLEVRPERHRIALLLLDNASELQLLRATESELSFDLVFEKWRATLSQQSPDALPPSLKKIATRRPVTKERAKRIRQRYTEKLNYLAGDKAKLAPAVSEVLLYLHEYRNHAYHGGRFTPGLVRALALLLFELNCRLLESLPPGVTVWSSVGDYGWLSEGYGIEGRVPDFKRSVTTIVGRLREGLAEHLEGVKPALADDLLSRLAQVGEAVTFICSAAKAATSREEALRLAQFHSLIESNELASPAPTLEDFVPSYGMDEFEKLRVAASTITRATDECGAFAKYARAAKRLQVLESDVFGFASALESYIQQQIDIARGK